ncbi:hypothetical protein [Sutcliffiella halmapala]|uniref:hypothetical protein n=1 Tax=Sutcliffiella halmapala TaxID=79882 RepID=UPI000995D639|nr:hypothetical protein [Sutcliffiella halmapala]
MEKALKGFEYKVNKDRINTQINRYLKTRRKSLNKDNERINTMTDKIIIWIGENIWAVSLFSLIIGAYLNTFLTKNKEVLMKVADKKGQYYADYISALLEFSKPVHQRMRENDEINRNYYYLKNLVILYGSSKVIENLAKCETDGIDIKTKEGKANYLNLIDSMKEDIENPKIIKSWWNRKFGSVERKENINNILFDFKQND